MKWCYIKDEVYEILMQKCKDVGDKQEIVNNIISYLLDKDVLDEIVQSIELCEKAHKYYNNLMDFTTKYTESNDDICIDMRRIKNQIIIDVEEAKANF